LVKVGFTSNERVVIAGLSEQGNSYQALIIELN